MWFLLFIKACRKYQFTYSLYSYCYLRLDLMPINTFEHIKVKEDCYCYNKNYNKLFRKAIKIMKEYRNNNK